FSIPAWPLIPNYFGQPQKLVADGDVSALHRTGVYLQANCVASRSQIYHAALVGEPLHVRNRQHTPVSDPLQDLPQTFLLRGADKQNMALLHIRKVGKAAQHQSPAVYRLSLQRLVKRGAERVLAINGDH